MSPFESQSSRLSVTTVCVVVVVVVVAAAVVVIRGGACVKLLENNNDDDNDGNVAKFVVADDVVDVDVDFIDVDGVVDDVVNVVDVAVKLGLRHPCALADANSLPDGSTQGTAAASCAGFNGVTIVVVAAVAVVVAVGRIDVAAVVVAVDARRVNETLNSHSRFARTMTSPCSSAIDLSRVSLNVSDCFFKLTHEVDETTVSVAAPSVASKRTRACSRLTRALAMASDKFERPNNVSPGES